MEAEHSPVETEAPSHDEMLIDFLISHPCLWDKSNHAFRNRTLKETNWKDIAARMQISSHAAIRRYKTLCERFRRETVKQQSIPNYTSNWNLFEKFASLKDFQMCGNKIKIKSEVGDINDSINVNNTQLVNSSLLYGGGGGGGSGIGVFAEMDFMNDNNDTINSDGFENPFDGGPIDGRGSGLCVEPTCIGGSTDLSTDTIAAFCQFLEANLKQLPEDQSDELIEDISNLLFRKKKQFKNDLNGEST